MGEDIDATIISVVAGTSPPLGFRQRLVTYMAGARFDDRTRTLAQWGQGLDIENLTHPSKPWERLAPTSVLTSLEWHALKHSMKGHEWPKGTTPERYESDMRSALNATTCDAHVGRHDGAHKAAASVRVAIAKHPRDTMFVVYNANRSRIVSCYIIAKASLATKLGNWVPCVRIDQ